MGTGNLSRDFLWARFQPIPAKALEVLNDFRVGGVWANSALYRRQRVKVTAPNLGDRAGILQVLFVQGFDVGGVLSTKV